jgi:hypothetical protein
MRERMLELLRKDPFTAFKVVLASGKAYEIRNSQHLAVGESEMTISEATSDRWAMLRMNQVARLVDAGA